jgi:GAF domain-containing protein
MMLWLPFVTTLVNLVALLVTIWLGLYLVTRSGRSRTAWLGSATLWAVGAWFLHNALQGGITNRLWIDWLGQVMKLSVPLWFHLTTQVSFAIAPSSSSRRRFTYLLIWLSYVLVLFQILESSGVLGATQPTTPEGPAIHFDDRWITPSFPLFLGLLIVLPALAVLNLWLARRQTQHPLLRQQASVLLLAAIVAYLSGVYSGVGVLLQLELPVFPADAGLGVSIFLLGYAVASYNALLEGRPVGRDALYSAVGLVVVVIVYSVVLLLLHLSGQLTLPAVVVVLIAAVITHALYDGGRAVLDRLFYHSNLRRLRADLRSLASETGAGGTLAERLQVLLNAVLRRVEMERGAIAVRQGDEFVVHAASMPEWSAYRLPAAHLLSDTIRPVATGETGELTQMTVLVPLHAGVEQVGALLLGGKSEHSADAPDEVTLLETLAEPVAVLLHTAQLQDTQAQLLNRTIAEFRERERRLQQQQHAILAPPLSQRADSLSLSEREVVSLVEKALRRLHDYGALGEQPLARLHVVEQQVAAQNDGRVVTPVDRGKALVQVLAQAMEKLRPDDVSPTTREVPGREWHAYLILHHSYVLEESTRDIMSWLYISEGTYNRTRREALRSLATTLLAMEESAVRET